MSKWTFREKWTFRGLAAANMFAVGMCVTVFTKKPTGDALDAEREKLEERLAELAAIKARFEASRRALRLATVVGRVALDYKMEEWRRKMFGDDESAKRSEAAIMELRSAQDAQEAAGLAVERAKTSEERQGGIEDAKAARSRVLAAAAEVERQELEDNSSMEAVHRRNAERLLKMARKNGGVYVKVAQHLSQLDYLLPPAYLEVFQSCLDDAPRSSYIDVRAVVQEEFNASIEALFDDFQREPMASASLAQVHVAYYQGEKVAVKIQHRGLRETSGGDLDACAFAVKMVSSFFPDFRMSWLVDEIAPHLPLELDFNEEAKNCERCREQFKRWRNIRVPRILHERSTERVCTMSFEEGINGADRKKLVTANIDVDAAASLAVTAFAKSIFSYGFVHCDPHSANLLFANMEKDSRHPRLVLLDHGLYKELDPKFRLEYARLWRSIVLADTKGIAESSKILGVGDLYPLFAAMLTQRPWDDVANPDMASLRSDSEGDAALLRGYAQRYVKEITMVLDRVPRQMLLLLKMSDCLRHLERNLVGAPYNEKPLNSHIITAHACADALFAHDWDFKAFMRVKLRLWAYDLNEKFRFKKKATTTSRTFVSVPDNVSSFATTTSSPSKTTPR